MLLFDFPPFICAHVHFQMEICYANVLSSGKHVVIESERLIRAPTHTHSPIGEKVLVLQQSIHMRPFLNGGKHGSKGGWGRRGRGLHKMKSDFAQFPKGNCKDWFLT